MNKVDLAIMHAVAEYPINTKDIDWTAPIADISDEIMSRLFDATLGSGLEYIELEEMHDYYIEGNLR